MLHFQDSVIPAQAGIQTLKSFPATRDKTKSIFNKAAGFRLAPE
ncbi:hypothetical protein MIZ01_1812 [Sideroxyarcus emersonii]|uniref:Uncharacterized protein n=1 Tax=Sideroxyarcus emersonii TaxID=2764705 RepID=A0AAN2BZA5_9PROT|nr:hypothetical protein MIZ01_1812 [Sideroxyarcus emersonii]